MIQQVQLYDDKIDFEENKKRGPFGDYANLDDIYKNSGKPRYDFFGVPVYSPFGIAAGPLPTPRFIQATLAKGYDIVTLKSVRTDTFPLNPYPQVRPLDLSGELDVNNPVRVDDIYKTPLSVANSFGIPSVKPKEWQKQMKDSFALTGEGQALLVAFQGTARGEGRDAFIEDHVKGVGLIRQTGARIVEINLSCPNEGEEVLACFDTDITSRIVHAVKTAYPDIKLIVKLAYFEDKQQLKELVKHIGKTVDGISAINTIPATILNRDNQEVFPGRPKAGVSGHPIKWAGLEMTKQLHQLREEFNMGYSIVGMGGVLSYDDFNEYRQAGADIVMSVTGAMWNPYLAQEIKEKL